jgi:hypothetical protein
MSVKRSAAGLLLVAVFAGCRRKPIDTGRLPEDPVLGALASSQWRAHLVAEERERKLAFDRRKLDGHRVVVAMLRTARDRYDRATTRQGVEKARALQVSTNAEIHDLIADIDRWGVNSNLLDDYAAMLALLSVDYPAARVASIGGNPRPLEDVKSSYDARERNVAAWLDEVATSSEEEP